MEEPYTGKQPGTSSSCWSPAWSHTAAGWHPILQSAVVASQPTGLCWSLLHEQHAQACCSMGLRSGLLAGHSIFSTPTFWRESLINPALLGRALSSWRIFGPRLFCLHQKMLYSLMENIMRSRKDVMEIHKDLKKEKTTVVTTAFTLGYVIKQGRMLWTWV